MANIYKEWIEPEKRTLDNNGKPCNFELKIEMGYETRVNLDRCLYAKLTVMHTDETPDAANDADFRNTVLKIFLSDNTVQTRDLSGNGVRINHFEDDAAWSGRNIIMLQVSGQAQKYGAVWDFDRRTDH